MTEVIKLPEGLAHSEVQVLSLTSGDILVLKLPEVDDPDKLAHGASRFLRALTRHIPGVRVGVIPHGMELEIVRAIEVGET